MRLAASSLRRRLARVALPAILALGAAVLIADQSQADPRPLSRALGSAGDVVVSDSQSGSAVLGGRAMVPGQSVTGSVTIGNAGDAPGRFALWSSNLMDEPGPGGGHLSDRLRLVVTDETPGRSTSQVYAGSLAGLTSAALGVFAPGQSHRYRMTVTFPDAPAGAGAYESAWVSVNFNWTAQPLDSATAPVPPPS
jgi:hypothetical protein